MSFSLKILASPGGQRDGEKLALREGENVLGRTAPPATVVVDGTKVSRKHCLFVVRGGQLRVSDLKSANGTFVNGKRQDAAVLKLKDRLVVGEFILEVAVE